MTDTQSGMDRKPMNVEGDFPDDLPELTDAERAALDSIPDDAVSHWWYGEKWNFETKTWDIDGR